ncbi:MAG: lysophospholipid acyltransferase family protein [Akkermansiaceae bacterium]|nr:lysophospholipid acyltransferase family protein [Akkermansiaceae bacterium]
MKLWCATLRFEVEDRARLATREGPVIYCLWHNRIFSVPAAWRRVTRGRDLRVVVLTSASHDGAMLARAVGVFGLGSVRGSTSRRAVAALVALRRALQEGTSVCVTPDGPRGPRYHFQAGALKLAESTGVPVVPVHVDFTSAWALRSWDGFRIPKPFSRVTVIFDEALAVPRGLGETDFDAWRVRLEGLLREGVKDLTESDLKR